MKSYFYNLAGGLKTSNTKTELGLQTKTVYWSEAKNIEIHKNRGIRRQNGNVKISQSPDGAAVLGLFGYEVGGDKIFLFNTALGNLYCIVNLMQPTLVLEGLSVSESGCYTRFLSGVIFSNGVDNLVYFNHKSIPRGRFVEATDANGVAIKGRAVTAYKSRLWVASGSKVYFSALGRYDDFSSPDDAGYINDFHSDIDDITAFQGYKDYLAIYKKNNVFLLSGNSPDDFAIQAFADKGASSHGMLVNANNRQYFFNGALFTLEQVGILSQIALGSELSLDIKESLADFQSDYAYPGCLLSYEAKNQLWLFCPLRAQEYINQIYIYDYVNDCWALRSLPQQITSAMSFDGKIYTAGAEGKIYQEDIGGTFDGQTIEFCWKSPFLALGEPNQRKCVDDFNFVLDDEYDNKFSFETYKDYNSSDLDDVISVDTASIGQFLWDNDALMWAGSESSQQPDFQEAVWIKGAESVYKSEITRSNYAVQLAIKGYEPSHNFALIGLEFKDVYYD